MAHQHAHRAHARAAAPQFPDANQVAQEVPTVVSVVYVTAKATFQGSIGGYSTVGVAIATDEKPAPTKAPAAAPSPTTPTTLVSKPKTTTSSVIPVDTKTSPSPLLAQSAKPTHSSSVLSSSSTGLPTAITSPKTTVGTSLALLAATGSLSSPSPTRAAATASSVSSSTPESSGGMSAGGMAGLAIGILLLVGTVLALILLCFRRKKKAAAKEAAARDAEQEKFQQVNRAASTRTTATAPRLSLRPVTQFLPNLGEKRQSRGNPLAMAPSNEKSDWPTTGQNNNVANPFGNHAETIDPTNARGPEVVQDVATMTGVAAASAATVGLKRYASKRENAPAPMDLTKSNPFQGPPSPTGTDFSVNSAAPGTPVQSRGGAAIAAAGGPANSVVHRVQLDFKPSMEDELELVAGQLVRVLHEYDDGWALCIRLDRSKQGVAPRTCLSTRPVKPRPMQNGPGPRGPGSPAMRGPGPQQRSPAGPPNGQRQMAPGALQIRPMTPNGQQPRPMSPAGMRPHPMAPGQQPRPMSPAQRMQQRPMTPTGQSPRPMAPEGRPRSNSAAQMQAPRMAQPGPSPMNPLPMPQYDGSGSSPPQGSVLGRKPVPGQAL